MLLLKTLQERGYLDVHPPEVKIVFFAMNTKKQEDLLGTEQNAKTSKTDLYTCMYSK